MKLNRSQNAIRNIKIGVINNIVGILLPFVIRTIIIRALGIEYLGVNSLFSSILSILSVTEMGFSSAIVYHMYRAIAEDDSMTINALLAFYKRVYRVIGSIILVLGLLLVPFLNYLVHGDYPSTINPVFVYLVFLLGSVISYFMFAYYGSLLQAFQRTDIVTTISLVISLIIYTIQIVTLLIVRNYYCYILIMLLSPILSNISTMVLTKKLYPQYKPEGELTTKIKANIRLKVGGLLINRLCQMSRNTFDSIFISMFLGLTQIAIYNNYYYIMNSITCFLGMIIASILAGAGNSVAIDSQEKNYADMRKMNFLYMWFGGWCTICLICLYQPFMKIWVGEELLLERLSVILFCLYFYVLRMGEIRGLYSDANGLWWENKYRAITETVVNILLNYFLGKAWGINGIIVATLISLFFINFCYGTHIVYRHYFTHYSIKIFYSYHLFYFLITCVVGGITFGICSLLKDSVPIFVIKMLICLIFPNALYVLCYRHTKIYQEAIPWLTERIPALNRRRKSI